MNIKQFRYSADNLGYLLYGERSALVIDGGAVEEILSFADKYKIQIKYAANTHSHPDHTLGTDKLINRTGALYLENKILRKNNIIEYGGREDSGLSHAGAYNGFSLFLHGRFTYYRRYSL